VKIRDELFDRVLALRGQLLEKGLRTELRHAIETEVFDLESDLGQLRRLPSKHDPMDELHLLYLARCRVINLGDIAIQSFLGAGQRGAVFKARHNTQGIDVAVKMLLFPRNDEEIFRFKQESTILSALDHKAIVKCLAGFSRSSYLGVGWFAMEFVEDAKEFSYFFKNGPRDNSALAALATACEGLEHAHSKDIIHRDVQPRNILVDKNGNAKILDFGCAQLSSHEHTFRPLGTLTTSAPEIFDDPRTVTSKADIFSVGTILYRWYYQKWPFFASSYGDAIRQLQETSPEYQELDSPDLEQLLKQVLRREPKERPTASGLAIELRRIQHDLNKSVATK
jgi:serine/threonine protein kinase